MSLFKNFKNCYIISILTLVSYAFFIITPLKAQTKTSDDEVKLGLVLSGGGAKGFAHIGVLKVLEEENIPITIIAGNSIGTIVGALYSVGYSAQDIEDFVRKQNWEMLLLDKIPHKLKSPFKQEFNQKYILQFDLNEKDYKPSLPSGYIRGNNILNLFCGITAQIPDSVNFSELPIPFACVAYNIDTGKEEVLEHGFLPRAMMSSMAVPGAFAPVNFNNMFLVDGGVINNFPVDVAKNMGADIIIGVDLEQEKDKSSEAASVASIFMSIVNHIEEEKHQKNIDLADVVINPKLKGVSMFDFKASAIDSIMEKGEIAAREQLPKIKELIANLKIKRNNTPEIAYDHKNEWLIKEVIIDNKHKKETNFINSTLKILPNTTYTTEEIDNATKRVYAYGNYDMVNYKIKPNGDGYNLELSIKDKREFKLMLGAAVNTIDWATIYANLSRYNNANIINLITLDTKIAVNPQLKFKMETHRMLFSTLGFDFMARYNNLNQYEQGHRFGNIDVVNLHASLYSYKNINDIINLGLGLSQHYTSSDSYHRDSKIKDSFDANYDGFYSELFSHIRIDNRDDAQIPTKGMLLNTSLSLIANKGDFSNIIPVASLNFNTVFALSPKYTLKADLHHRSIFNADRQHIGYANYAANTYNSYSDYSFPLLGQRGVRFLQPISTLGELGLRIKLFEKHYVTPRFQALLQFDQWRDIAFDNLTWSAGLTYQYSTKLGPIDFTLGYQNEFNELNFLGAIGYEF